MGRRRGRPLLGTSFALAQPFARPAAAPLDLAVLRVTRLVGQDVLQAAHLVMSPVGTRGQHEVCRVVPRGRPAHPLARMRAGPGDRRRGRRHRRARRPDHRRAHVLPLQGAIGRDLAPGGSALANALPCGRQGASRRARSFCRRVAIMVRAALVQHHGNPAERKHRGGRDDESEKPRLVHSATPWWFGPLP